MILVNRRFRYKSDIFDMAAIEIQMAFRSYRNYVLEIMQLQEQRRSSSRRSVNTIDSFARTIQNSWRRFCNQRVYRYFRDLVLHKLRGAPADLLRTIIARESDLLDRAAGVHVRFRLGGRAFPPKIYYKIFTHRALCDVNAFAPRDYVNERKQEPVSLHCKPPAASHKSNGDRTFSKSAASSSMQKTHIRVGGAYFESTVSSEESSGWYQRRDNNPWRVISAEVDDLFEHQPYSYLDPNESMTGGAQTSLATQFRKKQKQKTFHYSRLRRQQDVVQSRKKKKREWMLKAYMLTAGSNGINGGESEASASVTLQDGKHQTEYTDRVNIEMCDSFSSASEEGSRNLDIDLNRYGGGESWGEYVADKKHNFDDGIAGGSRKDERAMKGSGSKYDGDSGHPPRSTKYRAPATISDDLDGGAEDALLKWR